MIVSAILMFWIWQISFEIQLHQHVPEKSTNFVVSKNKHEPQYLRLTSLEIFFRSWFQLMYRVYMFNEWYPGGLQISLHVDLPDF